MIKFVAVFRKAESHFRVQIQRALSRAYLWCRGSGLNRRQMEISPRISPFFMEMYACLYCYDLRVVRNNACMTNSTKVENIAFIINFTLHPFSLTNKYISSYKNYKYLSFWFRK
jgi:hypothetical protein